MKEFCPNKASKEFKELAGIFGEDKAYFLWMRNKGNELDKAPNGAESKLFKTLLNEFNGDRVEALKAKAKVYSNDFWNWFGNWTEEDKENVSKVVDENGEPLITYHTSQSLELTDDIIRDYELHEYEDFRGIVTLLIRPNAIYTSSDKNISSSYAPSEQMLADEFELHSISQAEHRAEEWALREEAVYDEAYDKIHGHGNMLPLTDEEKKKIDAIVKLKFDDSKRNEYIWPTNPYRFESEELIGSQYALYTNLKRPLIIDAEGSNWDKILYNGGIYSTRDLEDSARISGYDGVIIKNVVDLGPFVRWETETPISNIIESFSSNQVKSAISNKQDIITGESGFSTIDDNIYHNLEDVPVETKEDVKNLILSLLRKYYNFRQTLAGNTKISTTQSTQDLAKKQLSLVLSSLGLPENTAYINENNLVRFNDIILERNIDSVSDIIGHSKETSLQEKLALFSFMLWKFPQLKGIVFKKLKGENGHFENGVVVVDPDASLDIAVEECLHPFVAAIRAENKELFDELLKEAQKDFKKLRGLISKSYPGTKEGHIIDRELELVTQALSRHFADLWDNKEVDENGNTVKSVWRKALDYILELLGLGRIDFIKPETTLRELAEAVYKANKIHISDAYFVRKMYNRNTKPSLQESVFDIYTNVEKQRVDYLKLVENQYRTSNPNASSEDIARIVQQSRIQYNKEQIDSVLKTHQSVIAESLEMSLYNGYYVAPSNLSDKQKQLYEWTINSLSSSTFESYKLEHNDVYNIVTPDQQAALNVIYQAIYNGDLQTLDKQLAKNYIRIFWKSDLIQAGLKLFDDGHNNVRKQEEKLAEAVTTINPEERIKNKTILDYIKNFWNELTKIAKKVFGGEQLSDEEKLNLKNGITSAIANSQDLDLSEGVQPIYDRLEGNFDSSKMLSDNDKAVFEQLKTGTHVRLKSLVSRNVKNQSLIADLKLRLEMMNNVNEDSIDEVFDSIQQFIETADIELQKTLNYINELKQQPISQWDALQINYIKQDLIGFYEGLLSSLNDMFNNPNSSIAKMNNLRVEEGSIDLAAATKQLRNDIVNLNDVYTRDIVLPYAEDLLVAFVNESDAVKDKPTFIKNMKHWLYQDCIYGDLQAGELIFGMASRSRSPIIRIMEKMMSDVEFEKGRTVLKRGRELMSLYNKIRPTVSQISFNNFQKMFMELDGEDGTSGLPTGYFVRDRNYGKFYAEKDAFESQLRDKYKSKGLKWVENQYTNQIQLIFPDTNYTDEHSVYNQYYDELDKWLDDHCERRYTLEYYKQKRRHLSPAALQAQSFIQRLIDLLVQQATTKNGNVDTNKLTLQQRQKLSSLRKLKLELASPYIFTTDSNGVVLILEKQGEDLEIARQIQSWNKFIQGKVKYVENNAAYEEDLKQMKEQYGEDSPQVKRFIYDNKQVKINPLFWDYLNSKINRAEQTAEYEELRSRYRDIINHVKDYNGFVVPDLSKFGTGLNQNASVWKELQRLEQRMSEIRRKGTKKSDDDFIDITQNMVPLLGGEDVTFYQYIQDKWAPQFNEHPELRDVYNSLFTYIDAKGTRRILEAFKYIGPSTEEFGPGIPSTITTLSSQYSEVDSNSEYVNERFDKTLGESLQPKIRKPGKPRIKGKIDYTNENYTKITSNKGYKDFYDLLIKTMNESNAEIPTKAVGRSYLMPQITGRGMSILGRSLIGHELFSSIGYGIQDFVGYKFAEQDKDVSTNWDLPRRPDGTVVNNIPIRFIKRLEDPKLISTDVIGSVMMYYDMAMNYALKSQNLPSLELLENAIDPTNAKPFIHNGRTRLEKLDKQYEKVKNLMDFRYYGKEDRNAYDESNSQNKVMQTTTQMSKRFRSFASLSMLALNFTTIEVGYIDAFLSAIADSVGGKYFDKSDLMVGYKETLLNLPAMLCNLGNPDTNNWMVCAMQYNQLSKSNSEIFDRTDQSRFSKMMHMTLMGGYTMADYMINTMILGATYNHYRLVDSPDGKSKMFMSKSDAVDLYMKYGYTEKEAINKYNSSKVTLRQAYSVVDGYLTPKKEYADYINKKLENQIAGRLRDRTHLYNGIIPSVEKAKIQQNVWGSYITLMRNFYVNTYWERAAVGYDYAEQEELPSGSFSRYVSEKAGMVNFETGETGNALGMAFLHGLKNYVLNAKRVLTHKDTEKLSKDQKYALKRISTEIAIIGFSTYMALFSLALARRYDDDDKKSAWVIDLVSGEEDVNDYDVNLGALKFNTSNAVNNGLNWLRWKFALLSTRTMTERSTFYWPGTAMELVRSVSTAQSYTNDLGYTIDLFMDLLSINGHDSSEYIKTGGYSGMTRGTRDLLKIAGPTGIDNLVRNWHTSGIKSTLNWYSGVTPNSFILPNKSTWEAQEGISNSSSSSNKSRSHKKSHR